MISSVDNDLVGAANRSDAMGVLAVWSHRARDLVPHLTEQTTDVRGFQILVEAFRLWESYQRESSESSERLGDFFMLVEQAFARTIGLRDGDWPLPGARRVRARAGEDPHISVVDPGWHLLGGQMAGGLWGLYRGAARRAGLLDENMAYLSPETREQADKHKSLSERSVNRLFEIVCRAMNDETVPLPSHGNDGLRRDLCESFDEVPLRDHLYAKLVKAGPLNQALAERLVDCDELDHRTFLNGAEDELKQHRSTLNGVVRCEDLLAVLEAIFLWLCASKGDTLKDAVADLPVDLRAVEQARVQFGDSGRYEGATAESRHARFHEELDTSNRIALAQSVLSLHKKVSDERGRAAWVWEENGRLRSDVDVPRPDGREFEIGLAWRNDYYLHPLRSIARQLSNLR